MRDILVTLLVFGSLPFILRNAYIGVYVWSWLSYMNPHRLTWGFAYNMPFAQIVAIATIGAFIFQAGKNKFPINGLTVTWLIFLFWMVISTVFAIFPDHAQILLIKVIKIQLVVLLTFFLIDSQRKIDLLIWTIVLSIGFFSVKGGLFTILTGGSFRVYGPPSSYIQENNSLALASLMVIPLMIYLYKTSSNKWIRYGMVTAVFLSLASVLGSQSRGALVAIIAVSGFFWLKSRTKILSGIFLLVLAVIGFLSMPDSWHERMATIQNYEEDASAMGRINAWQYSINVASDRLTGGGFHSWKPSSFAVYAPNPDAVHAAHSIFFGPLGDHGWPGLLMFVSILFIAWRYLRLVERKTNSEPKLYAENTLSKMLQVSLIAYCSGGAFLSLAYFDLPWHVVALAVLLKVQNIDMATKKIA